MQNGERLYKAMKLRIMTLEECLPLLPEGHGRIILAMVDARQVLFAFMLVQMQHYRESGTKEGKFLHKYVIKHLVEYAARCHILDPDGHKETLKWVEREIP